MIRVITCLQASQLYISSKADRMLSACLASALRLRHLSVASVMQLCCGVSKLCCLRHVRTRPLPRPLYRQAFPWRSKSNLWLKAVSTFMSHSFQAAATFVTMASAWCAHLKNDRCPLTPYRRLHWESLGLCSVEEGQCFCFAVEIDEVGVVRCNGPCIP